MNDSQTEIDKLKARMAEAAEYIERAIAGLKGSHIKSELLKTALDILKTEAER